MAQQFKRATVKTSEGYNDYYCVKASVPHIQGLKMDHPTLGEVKVFAGYWYGDLGFDFRWDITWHSDEEQAEILKSLGFEG